MTAPESKSLKLALIQAFLPGRSQGGVGHFAHQLALCLHENGHRVSMYSVDPPPPGSPYDSVRPPWADDPQLGRVKRVFGFAAWLRRVNLNGFDVVHALGDDAFLNTTVPVVRTMSGSAWDEMRHSGRLSTRLMFLAIYTGEVISAFRAARVVGISADSTRRVPRALEVIPQGIDLGVFRPGDTRHHQPTILAVGHRMDDRKRLAFLVSVFERHVLTAIPGARLVLVADDAVDGPSIEARRNLTLGELAEEYRRAWVFCLPSTYEGFGRPYAEALASGTPVVATPNPGAMEVLAAGRFGVIVSADELGDTLVGLLRSPGRRHELSEAGLSRAQDFSWARVTAAYERVYRDVRRAA